MNQLIYNDKAALLTDLAEYILKIGDDAINEHGRFDFVLTGGSSPKALYESFASTYKDQLDWTKVYFFFGDERYVAPEDPNYNGLMAKVSLLAPLEVAEDHIFYVNTRLTPPEAAAEYAHRLFEHFEGSTPTFDLILLGMGDEAHTASLFPGTEILNDTEATVKSTYVDKLATHRISFTAPLINRAQHVAFLVFGSSKAEAVKAVIEPEERNTNLYPAQLIQPAAGNLTWFLDEDAAALLSN
jgi:6-phosphogluconolactonase